MDDGDLRYIYGLGRIAQVDDSEVTHYYLSDALGSTMALTDASKGVVHTYEYDVFGAVSASSGSLANFFEFAGEQVDDSTDLQYLRARYYDVDSGRFLGRDPVAEMAPIGITHYVYAFNNPANFTDPWGTWPGCGICKKAIDAVADGASAVGEAIAEPIIDTFGPPYDWQKIAVLLDVLPVEVGCALVGGGVGLAVGDGAVIGGLAGYKACELAFGVANAVGTFEAIDSSSCNTGRKVAAHLLNAGNLLIDVGFSDPLSPIFVEAGISSATTALVDCGRRKE